MITTQPASQLVQRGGRAYTYFINCKMVCLNIITQFRQFHINMLAASSGKGNVTVWRPSLRLCVLSFL